MKKQINPSTKGHLIRGPFYLLLLVAVCAIPFALAQRNTTARRMAQPKTSSAMSAVMPRSQGEMPNDVMPLFSAARVSQFPLRNSGVGALKPLRVLPPPKAPAVVLYDQYNNLGTNVTLSATFTDLPSSNADLADDFLVPVGQTWRVLSIDADGAYFNGTGPATDWNVFIYADNGGLPGTQVYSTLQQPVTVNGTTFTVNLTPPAVLTPGTYWIEIQANMTFATQGEWGWTDRTVQSNSPAAWQNPGGSFGVCMTWGQRGATCGIDSGVPDQVFRINGTGTGLPSPTPTATPTATASPTCTPIVVMGSIGSGDPTQTDRLNRNGIPQTCPASTTCSIFGDEALRR